MSRLCLSVLPCLFLLADAAGAQPLDIQIELMNHIGTDISHKGDPISGRVLSPAHLQGDVVEGKITESRSGAKVGGTSVFSFSFDTLRHGTAAIPISSQFKSATNSRGKANLDEEGRMVRRAGGNVGKVAGTTGTGALLGRIAGGNRGAAIGAAAGAGVSILLVQIASDGPRIMFNAGSRFTIEAQSHGGPALSGLAATNQPVAVNAPTAAVVVAPPAQAVTASSAAVSPAVTAPTNPAAAPAITGAPPTAAPASTGSVAQPILTTLKSTFLPGEKTIFYDDFTDMAPDDAPPHFKIRGVAPELREGGGIRQLSVLSRGSMFPNLTGLPKNFTFEADMKLDGPRRSIASYILLSKGRQIFTLVLYAETKTSDLVASMRAPYQELGRKRIAVNWNDPAALAMWVQNGRLRVFMNGEKQLDFNQVEMPPIDQVEITHDIAGPKESIGYRRVRFAESTPDFSQTIGSSGRYVTHGILFDTGSDRLKPESGPVIQMIAQGLTANAGLKLLIEGHTDSTGNAAQNLDLSKRRAEAVKTVLCEQFQVDASRLSSAGLGATRPMESNDTPLGRAQNRRVEFVRQ